jgi:putative ABC transport system substrate-binding protein
MRAEEARMRRRDVLCGLLALCAAPSTLGQSAGSATVAVLIPFPESDPESQARRATFAAELDKFGWRAGRNLRLEVRHGVGDAELKRQAAEIAALKPAVILIQTNQALAAVRHQGISLPTVFVAVSDPVGGGYVASLARPGGNTTGFANFAPEMGAKWLEVLRELAPRIDSVIVLLNPNIAANLELARSLESAAGTLGISVAQVVSGDAAVLEQALASLPRERRAGLIVMPNPANTANQKQIFDAAARHKLPAIYPFRYYAANGGLAAYGIDIKEQFRLAAAYVDRILKGAKPAELPVQQPTKYELVINLRTARTLGLNVPAALLARADEVFE